MKAKVLISVLFGLGLLAILSSSLIHLSRHVLAQDADESDVQPLPTPSVTPVVRPLGPEGEEPGTEEMNHINEDSHTNDSYTPTLGLSSGITVSGNISGIWPIDSGPYVVVGDLVVPTGNTLNIQPGVEVRFAGNYRLTVYGDLLATGTAVAPVVFSSNQASPQPGDWRGIRFYNSGDNDRLRHVRVEFAQIGIDIDAYSDDTSPIIEYSLIAYSSYDGISISADAGSNDAYARPQVLTSTITLNDDDGIYVYGEGGGDYNDGYARPIIRNNTISDNGGDGIYLYGRGGSGTFADGNADGEIIHNRIANNGGYGIHGYGYGGGYGCSPYACISGSASPDIIDNVIAANDNTGIYVRANGWCSGGYCNIGDASPEVINNNIINNSGNGFSTSASDWQDYVDPKIINNTIVSNTLAGIRSTEEVYSSFDIYNNLIISNATGLSAYSGETPDVGCNGFWGNGVNFSNYPVDYGTITTTNANGDPSDTYYNIFLDPRFVNASAGDYHLGDASPAIDAGCDHSYAPDHDIDGDSRVQGIRYDLGSDEYRDAPSLYLPIILK